MMGRCGRTFNLDHIKVYTFADSLDASKAIFAPETEKQKKESMVGLNFCGGQLS
jgi:hypothetical protein